MKAQHTAELVWVYNDGGREAAGRLGKAQDCVCRAIAIATSEPYPMVYDLVNRMAVGERTGKRKRGKSTARTGVFKRTLELVMMQFPEFKWVPTMQIGSGCKVHLRADELPAGADELIARYESHTEGDLLDNAALNDGRSNAYDVAALKFRTALEKVGK